MNLTKFQECCREIFMGSFGRVWGWGFLFYFLYQAGIQYLTQIRHLNSTVATFWSTLGGVTAALAVAFIGGMLNKQEADQVVPRWLMRIEGFATGCIVAITGYMLTKHDLVAAVVAISTLKGETIVSVVCAMAVLRHLGYLQEPEPRDEAERQRQLFARRKRLFDDTVSCVLAVVGLIAMGYGSYTAKLAAIYAAGKVPTQADRTLVITLAVLAFIYFLASGYRQFLNQLYSTRVLRKGLPETTITTFFGMGQYYWAIIFAISVIPVLAYIKRANGVIEVSGASFVFGVFFGLMAFFAVMIMMMLNTKEKKSLLSRAIYHKGMGTLAASLVTLIFWLFFGKSAPNASQIAGIVLVFVAMLVANLSAWALQKWPAIPVRLGNVSAALHNFRLQHNLFL